MMGEITYVFEGTKAYAIREGHVIAANDDLDELERAVEELSVEDAPTPVVSSEIVTPSGIRGKVLGKVSGLWADEVTVRLENGNIVHLPVSAVKVAASEPEVHVNPVEALEQRLASRDVTDRASLEGRYNILEDAKERASALIREGASDADCARLDTIVVTADLEQQEIQDSVESLDAAEPFEAPAPFRTEVVEQESLGGNDSSWLADVTNEMIADAESTDYGKLMDEGPEAFTAELPDVAIADAGATREMASSFIGEKTAGTDPEVRDAYIKTFVARVEDCRRVELSQRKSYTKKEAAAQEDEFTDLPDDALFL